MTQSEITELRELYAKNERTLAFANGTRVEEYLDHREDAAMEVDDVEDLLCESLQKHIPALLAAAERVNVLEGLLHTAQGWGLGWHGGQCFIFRRGRCDCGRDALNDRITEALAQSTPLEPTVKVNIAALLGNIEDAAMQIPEPYRTYIARRAAAIYGHIPHELHIVTFEFESEPIEQKP